MSQLDGGVSGAGRQYSCLDQFVWCAGGGGGTSHHIFFGVFKNALLYCHNLLPRARDVFYDGTIVEAVNVPEFTPYSQHYTFNLDKSSGGVSIRTNDAACAVYCLLSILSRIIYKIALFCCFDSSIHCWMGFIFTVGHIYRLTPVYTCGMYWIYGTYYV